MNGSIAQTVIDFLKNPTVLAAGGFVVFVLIMNRVPKARAVWTTCFSTSAQPRGLVQFILSNLLFVLLLGTYMWTSYERHLDNPADKVVPTLTQIYHAAIQVSTQPDREGKIWLLVDLPATAKRFGLSLACVSTGIIFGLFMGVFPYVESLLKRFNLAMDKFVALSVLPLVMALLGIGLPFHVGLVVFAVWPTVVLTTYGEAKGFPDQLKIKARTLGASNWAQAFQVVLPGIWAKLLDVCIRLNFKSIAGLVFAAEMIVSSEGLGFRIAAVRRFMAMDVVIVYALLTTLLLFLLDISVSGFIKWRYPYYKG